MLSSCRTRTRRAMLAVAASAGVGCGSPSGPNLLGPDEVGLQVEYSTDGSTYLRATVTATNTGDRPLVGITGVGNPCGWEFRTHADDARSGSPVWSSSDSLCPAAGVPLRLAPGATQVFPVVDLPITEILARGAPGTLFFAARLHGVLETEDDPETGRPVSGPFTEWLPAGSVTLSK